MERVSQWWEGLTSSASLDAVKGVDGMVGRRLAMDGWCEVRVCVCEWVSQV